ncbi:MAG TPA: phosphomannomutase/phosphoglucomutase, partial [Exilispira sp.]|nr:phosphomannomutase/phosphoglucomutase [Exilispira sp.]
EHFTKKEKVVNIYDFDGYRIEFDDWWFNIRPSNTEPYLRLIVEARDKILLSQKLNEFSSILNPFLKN